MIGILDSLVEVILHRTVTMSLVRQDRERKGHSYHVELSYEGLEVGVLEVARKHLFGELLDLRPETKKQRKTIAVSKER